MFLAMACSLHSCACSNRRPCHRRDPSSKAGHFAWARRASLPTLLDAAQAILSNIALLYLDPSLWQMLRGSLLIFTALIAIVYRHRRLGCVDWLGIWTTVVGIVIVGVSAMLEDENIASRAPPGKLILGMGLVILSQVFEGLMAVLEEELLDDYPGTQPLDLAGVEGLWGLWFSTMIILPVTNILPEDAGEGIFESTVESFTMLVSSSKLIGFFIAYVAAVSAYCQAAVVVLALTSAIDYTIYEALRSISVWVVSVTLGVIWPDSGAGEKLNWMSFVRAAGFAIMLAGSMIYNRILKVPGFEKRQVVTTVVNEKGEEGQIAKEGLEEGSQSQPPLKDDVA